MLVNIRILKTDFSFSASYSGVQTTVQLAGGDTLAFYEYVRDVFRPGDFAIKRISTKKPDDVEDKDLRYIRVEYNDKVHICSTELIMLHSIDMSVDTITNYINSVIVPVIEDPNSYKVSENGIFSPREDVINKFVFIGIDGRKFLKGLKFKNIDRISNNDTETICKDLCTVMKKSVHKWMLETKELIDYFQSEGMSENTLSSNSRLWDIKDMSVIDLYNTLDNPQFLVANLVDKNFSVGETIVTRDFGIRVVRKRDFVKVDAYFNDEITGRKLYSYRYYKLCSSPTGLECVKEDTTQLEEILLAIEIASDIPLESIIRTLKDAISGRNGMLKCNPIYQSGRHFHQQQQYQPQGDPHWNVNTFPPYKK